MLVFSLYRDEHALDKELEDCLKGVGADKMEVEEEDPEKKPQKSSSRGRPVTTSSKKAETKTEKPKPSSSKPKEDKDLNKQFKKMNINEEEAAINRAVAPESRTYTRSNMKELKASVFAGFASALKKSKTSMVTFEQLYKALPSLSKEDIKAAVVELDEDGKLHLEGNSIHQV